MSLRRKLAIMAATANRVYPNMVVAAKAKNCEVGDMLVYDTQTLKHGLLKMATYDAATFNKYNPSTGTGRYIMSEALWHRTLEGTGLFVRKNQVTAAWGAQCEFKISGIDLTAAGSFDFLSTGYRAKATATTISWEAGATLDSVKAQFVTGNGATLGSASYSSVAIDGNDLIFMIGGTGTNKITLSNLADGGANVVLTDYSKYCKINGVELTGDGNEVHRSFQGSTVATCFPSLASDLLPVTSACYTVAGVNRPYRCGLSFQIFKSYVTNNGTATFVDDTTSGSTFPMKKSKFDECGESSIANEKACYDRHNGNYDDYLRMGMVDIDSVYGTVGNARGNFGKEGRTLAPIFYRNHNNEWKPCYPAAYQASLMGVTVAGYTTGFESGNFYLPDSYEMSSFMDDAKRLVLNGYITTLGGGTTLGSSYLWTGSEFSSYYAWNFYASNGYLYNGSKMGSCAVRGSLAFRFQS